MLHQPRKKTFTGLLALFCTVHKLLMADIVVENDARACSILLVADLWTAHQAWFDEACPDRDPCDVHAFRIEPATASAYSTTWDGTRLSPQDSIRMPKRAWA